MFRSGSETSSADVEEDARLRVSHDWGATFITRMFALLGCLFIDDLF